MQNKIIRIANGQGFWGDSILGPVRLLREGPIDYLTLDYLAEVTMSIMQKLKSRNAQAGYATDFIKLLQRILPEAQEKGVRIIASAGGVNAQACLEAAGDVVQSLGLSGVKIATITGDDILHRLDELQASGEKFLNMDTGAAWTDVHDKVTSANVYLGAAGIVEALNQGADIVICGRVTDPALVLGPMIHEFGWSFNDYNKLAAGTVAGHIVECGAQCTGANYTNWRKIKDFAMIGYPVIEMQSDGEFVITKHPNTGGEVSTESVISQLMYEMGDPQNYITPDVVVDFTTVHLAGAGTDRVQISGVQGKEATPFLKVSASYSNGYKAVGQLTIAGPDALEKAKICAEIIWKRLEYDGLNFAPENKLVEFLGAAVCHAGIAPEPEQSDEIVLRIGVKDTEKSRVDRFGM
ncbi:MAG: DUF1446 domain-containing protein, partial [Calditrichaeota bacterium]